MSTGSPNAVSLRTASVVASASRACSQTCVGERDDGRLVGRSGRCRGSWNSSGRIR